MLFGKLMLQKPNVLVMDEPTNHLDMESIESLNLALENYPGHADLRQPRPRVRIIAGHAHHRTDATGVVNFSGNYDDYLHSQGVEVPGAAPAGKKTGSGRK